MKRLIEKIVFCGFVTCCRRAGAPTSRCPSFVNATTDGVVRPPSAFGMTVGSPPSMHGHARVRRAEVDANGLCHVAVVPPVRCSVRKSEPDRSRSWTASAECPDQRAAGDDQRRAEDEPLADAFGVAEEDERQDDTGERLDGDERRDDGHAAAVVRLEERDVRGAEQEPRRNEAQPAPRRPRGAPRGRRELRRRSAPRLPRPPAAPSSAPPRGAARGCRGSRRASRRRMRTRARSAGNARGAARSRASSIPPATMSTAPATRAASNRLAEHDDRDRHGDERRHAEDHRHA